jgi:lipopolysaccharide export system protein LptC
MSEAAVQERLKKQGWAAPGGAHDWLVGVLKIGLPAAVGVVAAYLAVAPLQKSQDVSFILDKNKVEVAKERMRLASARYRGQDDKGRPFSIDAQSAVQATSAVPIVDITGMSARLDLEDGPAALQANRANYDMDTERAKVIGPILFTGANGYRLETRDVTVDLNSRTLTGDNGVAGWMPLGRFTAQRMAADLGQRSVVLNGRARLHIEQGAMR